MAFYPFMIETDRDLRIDPFESKRFAEYLVIKEKVK
jgi:hypothetical protein